LVSKCDTQPVFQVWVLKGSKRFVDGEFNDYCFRLSDGSWYLLKRWVPSEAGNYQAVFLCYIRGGEAPPVPDIAELDFRILVSPPEVHSWRMFCQGKRYRAWRVAAFNLQELIQIDSNVLDYVETFRLSVNPYKELADDVILSFDYPFYDNKFDDYHKLEAFRSDEYKFSKTFYDYFQTASETLLTRVGDCEDGAILYTTCARALGLHADRVYTALGVVKDDKGNVLGGHAWSLVKWDDYWRLIETTLSEPYNYDLLIVGQTIEDIKKPFKYKTIIYQPNALWNDENLIDIDLQSILLPTLPFKFEDGKFRIKTRKRAKKESMDKYRAISSVFGVETKPLRRKL
jgi:hypothetical protein